MGDKIMFNRVWFKDLAKEQIRPNLGPLALIFVIYTAIVGGLYTVLYIGIIVAAGMDSVLESEGLITAFVSLISCAIYYIFFGPLLLGIQKAYIGLTYGEKPKVSDIFYAFTSAKLFWASVRLFLLMTLFVGLWSLLFIVPGIIRSIDYMQSWYLLIANPEKGARECLRESIYLTKGHRADIFVTSLSFILWSMTSMIPFVGIFIVYGYVYPYIMATMANIHRFLIDEKYGSISSPTEY
jgi:uncharacterized membrane protein